MTAASFTFATYRDAILAAPRAVLFWARWPRVTGALGLSLRFEPLPVAPARDGDIPAASHWLADRELADQLVRHRRMLAKRESSAILDGIDIATPA